MKLGLTKLRNANMKIKLLIVEFLCTPGNIQSMQCAMSEVYKIVWNLTCEDCTKKLVYLLLTKNYRDLLKNTYKLVIFY